MDWFLHLLQIPNHFRDLPEGTLGILEIKSVYIAIYERGRSEESA
jgi:hypothetical protein